MTDVTKEPTNLNTTNLLAETILFMAEMGKKPDDVLWVQNGHQVGDWKDFEKLAMNFWYDSGFGFQYVSPHLRIVGEGWWLDREEYDGSEGWSGYFYPPTKNMNAPPLQTLEND